MSHHIGNTATGVPLVNMALIQNQGRTLSPMPGFFERVDTPPRNDDNRCHMLLFLGGTSLAAAAAAAVAAAAATAAATTAAAAACCFTVNGSNTPQMT